MKRNIEPLQKIDSQLACLTLDLENDWYFEDRGYDHLTFGYIDQFVDLINELDIPLTVFVVGKTLERFPEDVDKIREEIESEFHLHSYRHDITKSYDFIEEINLGIDAFESYFGERPIGYRAPQGNITTEEICRLDDAGFEFDSSIFPSYRPGIYNNLDAPTYPYRPWGTENFVEYPISVLPRLRIPLSQSYLKLFGRTFLALLKRISLPNLLVFDSHLQDFYRTASHKNLDTPLRQIHSRNLDNSIELFRSLIQHLREKGYEFTRLTDVHNRLTSK